jgi:hypothetical protein
MESKNNAGFQVYAKQKNNQQKKFKEIIKTISPLSKTT